jgi:hypothetical protein
MDTDSISAQDWTAYHTIEHGSSALHTNAEKEEQQQSLLRLHLPHSSSKNNDDSKNDLYKGTERWKNNSNSNHFIAVL